MAPINESEQLALGMCMQNELASCSPPVMKRHIYPHFCTPTLYETRMLDVNELWAAKHIQSEVHLRITRNVLSMDGILFSVES